MLAEQLVTKQKVVVRQDNVKLISEALNKAQTTDPVQVFTEAIALLMKQGFTSEASAKHDLISRNLKPETLPKFIKDCNLGFEVTPKNLARRALSLRAELKLNQIQLSKALMISTSTISGIENGKVKHEKAIEYLIDLEIYADGVRKGNVVKPGKKAAEPVDREEQKMQKGAVNIVNNDSHEVMSVSSSATSTVRAGEPAKSLNLDTALEIITNKPKKNSDMAKLQEIIDAQNARLAKLESAVELIAIHLARG